MGARYMRASSAADVTSGGAMGEVPAPSSRLSSADSARAAPRLGRATPPLDLPLGPLSMARTASLRSMPSGGLSARS